MIPGGYSGHLLETDSLSSGEYEDDDDDDINDALTLHPGNLDNGNLDNHYSPP